MTLLCWAEVGDKEILGPKVIQKTTKKIRTIQQKMIKDLDGHKSYVDQRRRPLDFEEGNHAFLKVTPKLGLKGMFKTKKLSQRYIGPYGIISWVDRVPPSQFALHDVFHVSQLRNYVLDSFQFILLDIVEVADDISFQPQSIHIVDYLIKVLRNKEIPLMKVLWEELHMGEANWELESKMRAKYTHIFK
ncbi:uncharacterized protein LOC127104797 [Lathyrus oleraceus]|uniref:uncharacterized protein LOC127104797 n=1 Tax=Pisum sativum TaxID=3888 RepID=UPI0021D2FC69|nr:uncharacterized protein LOC127104797 [Pisum sativum]